MNNNPQHIPAGSLLSIRGLGVRLRTPKGEKRLLGNLNLELAQGGCAFIVGRSGVGKSLMARSVLGLLDSTWSLEGDISLRGAPLLKNGVRQEANLSKALGRDLTAVFQEPGAHLHPSLSIKRQLEECLSHAPRHEREDRARRLIRLVDLPVTRTLKSYAHQFSQGERQRLCLAMALAYRGLIICDEPTASLDDTRKKDMTALLRRIRNQGITAGLVVITHQAELINALIRPGDPVLGLSPTEEGACGQAVAWQEGMTPSRINTCFEFDPDPLPGGRGFKGDTPLLKVRDMRQAYKPRFWAAPVPVLREVNLKIHPGEMVGLIGASGSGKTTLAKAVARLLDHTGGRVEFYSEPGLPPVDLVALQPRGRNRDLPEMHRLRPRLQYISQDAALVFNPAMRIGDILTETLGLAGAVEAEGARRRMVTHLAGVGLLKGESGLEELLSRFPGDLSGGEKQRLNLARAFLLNPRLVMADEPFANQDLRTASELVNIMRDYQQRNHTAFLLISHKMEVVERICDRVYRVNRRGSLDLWKNGVRKAHGEAGS